MPNAEMKTLTIGDTTYEIVDEEARESVGDLSDLTTTEKSDLVAAINEVAADGGQVASVNGKTGVVVLAAADVGAATTGALTDETTARTAADAQLQGQITALGNGAPIPVSTIAAMTVQTQVYLYTGSETGESTGYWYTYDSTQAKFVPRGEYGGAVTDTTLSISGMPADAKATGDALAELNDRVETLESGGEDVPYEEKGDLHTLFVSAEEVEMRKTDYRLNYNASTGAVTEQAYSAGHPAIHYIDPSELGYPRLWIHRLTAYEWSVFADYDPDDDSYTFIAAGPSGNSGKLIDFSAVAEGHYIAVSSVPAYWKTGYYIYLGRVWIKPGYVSKYEGWDVPVSDEPIPCDLYPVSVSYPAFYIDMEKYQDRLVRLINSGTMSTTSYGFRAYTDLAGTSYVDISSLFSIGDFSAWIYPGRYLVFFYRGKMTENTLNLTMGYVPVENALKFKQQKKWGPKIAFHNVDTRNEMIFACAVGSIFDIDVCRTLDGKFVCIHATTINGHTIAQTNLEDLELTYNQMEVTDALKLMREYGVINYFNFRETTPAQVLELVDRAYNYLGDTIAYDSNITEAGSELANHLDKYYTWLSGSTLDALINLGASKGRIFAWASALEGTAYNVADIIVCKSVASGETLSNYTWDGECAVLWVNSDTPGFVRG